MIVPFFLLSHRYRRLRCHIYGLKSFSVGCNVFCSNGTILDMCRYAS